MSTRSPIINYCIVLCMLMTTSALIIFLGVEYETYQWLTTIGGIIIGSTLSLTPTLYEHIVKKPLLKISFDPENKDLYKPQLQIFPSPHGLPSGTIGRYLRLLVKNEGYAAAINVECKVKVKDRPKINGKICQAPSREYDTFKSVTWAGTPKDKRMIPQGGNAIIDLIIMYMLPDGNLFEGDWHETRTFGPVIAWFATPDVVDPRAGPLKSRQDGLCQGMYTIEIAILAENSKPLTKKYKLIINKNWNEVSLIEI